MSQSNNTKVKIVALTDVGKERDHNEDNYIYNPDVSAKEWIFDDKAIELKHEKNGSVLIVADGMGGQNAGEVASWLAIQNIKEYFNKQVNIKLEENEIKKILGKALS